MIVRRATIEDGKEIFAIEAECFSVPWSLDSIETEQDIESVVNA